MYRTISLVGFGLIVALCTGVTAQQLIPPDPTLRFVEPWRPTTVTGQTQIVGTVVDIRQVPVANARVRLRNLNTGRIEQEAQTNDKGEYVFAVVDPGTYVVEMVMLEGSIVALSNAGAVARYETLQTVIQLPGVWNIASRNVVMQTNVSNFVGMSSASTMTAATLTMAAQQNIKPLDSGEPVSP